MNTISLVFRNIVLRWLPVALALVVLIILIGEAAFRVMGVTPATIITDAGAVPEHIQPLPNPSFEVDRRGYWIARPHMEGVNDEGFRIAATNPEQQGAPALLLLGSDVAWGSDTFANSATAILREAGYTVHNLATPKAPHTQWPLLMNTYVERLRPDRVVVMLDVAQDLERPLPITPQQAPYYQTNAGLIRAIDLQGERLSFTQAVEAHRKAIAGPMPWLVPFSAYSALAYGMIERKTYGGMAYWDLAAVVESLELVHIAATKQGAEFLLVLVEAPPTHPFADQQNQRAATALATFEPAIYARPYAQRYDKMNRVQSELAVFLGGLLRDQGLAPPRPAVLDALQVQQGGGIPWRFWQDRLGLDAAQSQQLETIINQFKDDAAALLSLPPADGDQSPVAALAAQASGAEVAALFADVVMKRPQGESDTYTALLGALEHETTMAIAEELDDFQRTQLSQMNINSLLDIETGHDPVGDAVSRMLLSVSPDVDLGNGTRPSRQEEEISFERFAAHLELDEAHHESVRAILNELKDGISAVLGRPAKDSDESPLDYVAARLRDEGAEAEASLNAFMARHLDGETGKRYTDSLMEAETEARNKLLEVLDEAQRGRLPSLPVAALMHVNTGYDPMGAWLEARYREAMEASVADAEMERWRRMSARLNLDDEQREQLEQRINLLKEEIAVLLFSPPNDDEPSPGAYLAQRQNANDENAIAAFATYADEMKAPGTELTYNARMKQLDDELREALGEFLRPEQIEQLEAMPFTLLSDIPTGYDPFGRRLQTYYVHE